MRLELVIEVKVNKGAATIINAETSTASSTNVSATNVSATNKSDQDKIAADQTTTSGTTENRTDSDAAAAVQIIKNIATSDLGNNPQDTNEVVNNLKGESKQSKQDLMPEDEPSYKKVAQTGSKDLLS